MRSERTAAEILRDLVAIPTPSAVSNLPLLRWVQAFVEGRGWRAEQMPYRDEAGVEKANLLAWPGSAECPRFAPIAFVCHTDTVPYAESWQGALRLEQREGSLHGCGACDVKGALACFLAALSRLECAEMPATPVLILTADEEIGCKGVERWLASTEMRIGSAIVSEPTSLRAGIAGKGYGLARITVEGREAHSAFPQQGVSAIAAAARLLVRIEEAVVLNAQAMPVDSLFDPPRTTFNIGTIEGGTAKNIIPGRCCFLVEWRSIPGEAPNAALARLEALLAEAQRAEPRVTMDLQGLRADPGFAPAPAGALRQWLAERLGPETMGISFGSEASRLARIAEEAIVIGPGDMRTAHSERECVPVAELERWTSILMQWMREPSWTPVKTSFI